MSSAVYVMMLAERGESMEQKEIEDIIKKVMAILEKEKTAAGETGFRGIPLEISARHVHLSEEHIRILFDKGLTEKRALSQPGQFLAEERVRLIGPKGVIDNVAVLGPARLHTQTEISATDAMKLGVDAPVRQSGDIDGTPGILIAVGDRIVRVETGTIVAARHIHMSPEDAEQFSLKDKALVDVEVGGGRPMVFRKVLVRVHREFRLAMHIDFDEANACACGKNTEVLLIRDVLIRDGGTDPLRSRGFQSDLPLYSGRPAAADPIPVRNGGTNLSGTGANQCDPPLYRGRSVSADPIPVRNRVSPALLRDTPLYRGRAVSADPTSFERPARRYSSTEKILINEGFILNAAKEGEKSMTIPSNAVMTPLARDAAISKGIEITRSGVINDYR